MRKLLKARRFLSLVLAVAMVFSIMSTLTVFAEENVAIEAGVMKQNENQPNLNSGSFYFMMDENAIPYDTGWENTFYSTSADCIKLIRNGGEAVSIAQGEGRGVLVKYDATGYYFNGGNGWFLGDSAPLVAGDIVIVEGQFTNGTTTFNVSKSVIVIGEDGALTFGTEVPSEPSVIEAGVMKQNENQPNLNNGSFYFMMDENTVPYDTGWENTFYSTSADCIKLIRNGGEAVSIAQGEGRGVLVKYDATGYYFNGGNGWFLGDSAPLVAGDIVIVEGQFTNGTTTFNVSKSVIVIGEDGALTFGTEVPSEPSVIEAGVMKQNENQPNLNNGSFYFMMDENAVPYDTGWENTFYSTSADCIKLIRNGGEAVGIAQGEGRGVLVKYDATSYYFNGGNGWFLGDSAPLVAGDIVIVEGQFTNGTTTFNVSKSVIVIGEDGALTFGTEVPEEPDAGETVIEAGTMGSHEAGKTDSGFYFSMPENAVPADDTWATRYTPASTEVIMLTRNGETKPVGNTAAPTVLKFSSTGYWIDFWTIGGALIPGDILMVEGNFSNAQNGVTFHISRSYIVVASDGSYTFLTELPTEPTVIEAGAMQSDSRGKTDTGIYFAMSVNTAPYDTGWNLLYAPEKADCIKLIRSGETKSVANTAAGTIVKFSATEYYLKTEAWTIGDVWPLAEGDILEIEGNFVNADHDVTIHISKSYIQIKNGQALFSTEMPTEEPKEVIQAGNMQQDPRGKTANGLYFTMKTNKAPFATDWTLLYAPVGEESIKLIRNGKTSNIAIPGRGTIVKYSDTEYYLKTEAWTMGELMPLIDGDILVIEGQFANGETVMEISKSYVSISNGVAKISTEYPSGGETEIIEAGVMQKDPERTSLSVDLENGSCGLYFTMPENAIPMNETDPWANRFRPVSADSVKLIRNGATLNIGNPEVGEIVKFGAANYYLALDKWAHAEIFPITTNDILLIEGNFTDGTTVFHISKSYVSFSHGLVCITQDYPKGDESGATVVNVSNLTSDARGRTDTGIYFDAKANAAPYDTGWNTSYAPVSTGCVKLIRNGSTTDVAIPGRGTIVKFSSTEYYLKTETWTMGAMMPIVEGDILVIEGEFADGASGTIINIPKTYIGIWYGMPFFSTTYPTGPSLSRVYAGMMKNDTREMTATGVYFDMDKNAAPYKTDWTLLYSPVYSSAVQLIRDGKTMSVGIPNRGAIVKFSDTEYYLKTEVWSLGGMMPLQDGDILVVGGQFINAEAGTILNIDKTYIFIQNGKAVIAKPMESIEVANDESKILKLEGLPTGAKVEWTSENEKRVTVDENGKITAHMNRGKVRIFATYENASYFWTVQLFERTPYGNVYLSSSDEEMPVGVWCGSYHEFDETHMLQLEEAGVNLIIGVDEQWVGGGGMFALLNRARDHGISVIVNLRDWDGKTVPSYAKHPALKGFLMWDEPSATDFEKLAETKKKFDELMPENLIFFVNLFPQTSSYEHLFGEGYSPKAVDYENNYIDLFVDEVDPEQLSVDYYPLMKQDGNENLLVKPSYFENLDTLANKAKEEKLPFDWTILAAGHKAGDGTYVTPTEEQLRWQMAVALAYGASSITHYIYASHEEDYESMIEWETYKPTDVYTRVKTVNQELKTWNDIYMSYSWLGTSKVDVGDKNLMLERLDYDVPVSKYGCLSEVASDKDLLVGAFENAEHQYAYMITNAGDAKKLNDIDYLAEFAMESASVTLHFKPGEYQCVAVVVDGEISFMPVNEDNSITLDIGAYDGAFVMPMAEGNVAMYAVKTGDSMHMYAVISAFVLSAAGIAGVVFAARNKRHQ